MVYELWGNGEIGKLVSLKNSWPLKPCRFEADFPYQLLS